MEALLPGKYRELKEREIISSIRELKLKIGERLIILTHHYQRSEIIKLGDVRGDSFGLSKKAKESNAEFIIFCGVNFMAESADILSHDFQMVHLPDIYAGCPMADMADMVDVESAWDEMGSICGSDLTPITYINSKAELKAFCGEKGGSVCTSTNAFKIISWGLKEKGRVFFFPDQHLGRNIGKRIGIPEDEIIVWDPQKAKGGNSISEIKRAKIILWNGYCHVHTWFVPEHIERVRKKYPDAAIVVHPECTEEVVDMADYYGSTNFICEFVENAPSGSSIAIGTEINLVSRLAKENPDKNIFELSRSLCPNMYKIGLEDLLWTLENIGDVNLVNVPVDIKKKARTALEMMFTI
ncbi:MAG: quinolinate synthase NadA [Nitrospirota bacterium]